MPSHEILLSVAQAAVPELLQCVIPQGVEVEEVQGEGTAIVVADIQSHSAKLSTIRQSHCSTQRGQKIFVGLSHLFTSQRPVRPHRGPEEAKQP